MPDPIQQQSATPELDAFISAPSNSGSPTPGPASGTPELDSFVHDGLMEDKYGSGVANPLLAAGLGAANTATFGMANRALSPFVPKEALEELPKQNPISYGVGSAAGVLGSVALAPEMGAFEALNAPAQIIKAGKGLSGILDVAPEAASGASKLLSSLGSKFAGGALEGALFKAGDLNAEYAVGDPKLTSEQVLGELGLAGVLGGSLGVGHEALSQAYQNFAGSSVKEMGLADSIRDNANAQVPAETGPPTSIEDMQRLVDKSKSVLGDTELPPKQELSNAAAMVPDLSPPVHPLQLSSLQDQASRDFYKGEVENPNSKEGQIFRDYEAIQKRDALGKLKSTVQDLAPNSTLTADPVQGGNKLIKDFHSQYKAEKAEMAPLFNKFDKVAVNPISYPGELVGRLEEAIPGVSKHLDFNGIDGNVELAKYEPTMPFSKNVYDGINDLVNTINKDGTTLGDIRELRNTLGDRVNLLSAPRDSLAIGKLKSSLMDFIAGEANKVDPSSNVQGLFKRYAINEQNRGVIENIFGGKIGDNVSFAKKIIPEDALKNLFSDSVSADAARQILPKDSFNEALGNHLSAMIEKSTDNTGKGFSSAKFATFLKGKGPELDSAFSDRPESLGRIKALTTIMKILPDSPSINPSGTAKTLSLIMKNANPFRFLWGPKGVALGAIKDAGEYASNALQQGYKREVINSMLEGNTHAGAEAQASERAFGYAQLNKLKTLVDKSNQKIQTGVSNFFKLDPSLDSKSYLAVPLTKSREDFDKVVNQYSKYSQNPQLLVDKLTEATKNLPEMAPNMTNGINLGVSKAVGFLNSKIPPQPADGMFPRKFVPNQSQTHDFLNYARVIEKPSSILDDLNSGRLSPNSVDALKSVYPNYYNAISQELLSQIPKQKEPVSYQKKLALSLFLGQDVDSSTQGLSIANNQAPFMLQKAGLSSQGKPNSKGLSNLDSATRVQTPQEQTSRREENS